MSGSRYHRIVYLPVLAMAIFTCLQFSAAVDYDHSVKCTKMNPCHMPGYSCVFRHASDYEGVCVGGQENGVSQLWPYEMVTQWPTKKKGQQRTSPAPAVVRTNDPPKTSSSCTVTPLPDVLLHPQPVEISDAPFQPESEPSVDPKLASNTPDQSESTLSNTPFSPDSISPKSISVLEPPNKRKLPGEVTTKSQEATSADTGNQHTDRKKETMKPAESRFQEIRQKQREVLKTLMTHLANKYGEQLGMVMMGNKRETRLTDVEGHKHREAGLKETEEHIHRETGLKETEGHIHRDAGLKKTEGHIHRDAGLKKTDLEGHIHRDAGLKKTEGHIHRDAGLKKTDLEGHIHRDAGLKKTDLEGHIHIDAGHNSMMGTQNGETGREKRFSEFENQEHIWDDIEEDWSDTWDVPEDEPDASEDWSVPSDDDKNVYAPAEPDLVHSPGIEHGNGIHDTEYETYPSLEEPPYGTEEDSYPGELSDGDRDMTERKKSSSILGSRATQLHPLLSLTNVLIIIVAAL